MLRKKIIISLSFVVILILSFLAYYSILKKKKTNNNNLAISSVQQDKIQTIKSFDDVALNLEKKNYKSGEEVRLLVIIHNPFFIEKEWALSYFFLSLDEKYSLVGQSKDIKMKPGQAEKFEFITPIYPNLPPGKYKLKVDTLEKNQVINSKALTINIEGTNNLLSAEVKICGDAKCENEKSVFYQNENLYARIISSDMKNLNVEGKVRCSNNDEWKKMNFKYNISSFKLDKSGSCEAIVEIQKRESEKLTFKKDFSILAEEPNIRKVSSCNADGKCNNNENSQNCPQDCLLYK